MPEYYEKLSRAQVLRDPVHNFIEIDDQLILDLIDTKEMQRMRRIKQLGTTFFVFPGGEHSRFSHSVGVYEITRKICDVFEAEFSLESGYPDGWDKANRLTALCAALLHDVGHGPYSHTFEHIFETNHEEMTNRIILDETTEVNQVLRKVSADFPLEVASVISHRHPNKQLVQMISSQIDADRMDYLLRDSYFTGTGYGVFDLTRILRAIRPHKTGIVFSKSTMHAVEDYVISRYQMYVQVYFHPTIVGCEMVLINLLKRARDYFDSHPEEIERHASLLAPIFYRDVSVSDYLNLDDGVLNAYFIKWQNSEDEILRDLSQRYLNRKHFVGASIDEVDVDAVKASLLAQGLDPRYYTRESSALNMPYAADEAKTEPIKLIDKNGALVNLNEVSPLIDSFNGELYILERFYFPK
ncbi:MAG: HD domain-containing protein [Lactobacillales bacterium]|jgi:HD superfamily phosphohydrolase|nr:HD domain-containing protein [Lactobacillales bacterium]